MHTLEEAKRIIEAFGPCTVLYECTTPEELVKQLQHYQEQKGGPALQDYLEVLLDVEGIYAEREGDVCLCEWTDIMRPGVLSRLADIGYVVKV